MSGIQGALKFWLEFNVNEFQRDLDSEGQAVARRQDESDASRKKLVDLSRDFKKTSSEEVRHKVAPLLKSFQGEVDSLSRRSLSAETAFLSAYKRIIAIPDPIPVLEQALGQQQRLQQSQDHEIEVKQLRETLQEYNAEFAHVKNQEGTIQKLREQLRELEDMIEGRAAAKVSEKSAELVRTFEEKEKSIQAKMEETLQKLSQTEQRAATMQSALEATQSELFELKNKYDEDAVAKSAELDILMTDLERANQRAAAMEKELEKAQQGRAVNTSLLQVSSDRIELEMELQARDKEITGLVQDTQRLQSSLTRLREASSAQTSALEDQLASRSTAIAQLEEKVNLQRDYDEIKRELSVIKMIEFSTSAQSFDAPQSREATDVAPSKPLEVLLLEKNRALQNENMSLKLELSELREHFTSLEQQHRASLQSLQEQKTLIAQLESDLSQVQPFLAASVEGQEPVASAQIMSNALRDVEPDRAKVTMPDDVMGGASSLLPIVSSQRERFKQRNVELEAECHQQKQTISVLQREVDTIRGDNVKLYEKIKFLQSYPGTRKTVDDHDALSRYSSQYEANLDPFSAFGMKERQRRYTQLSGIDKATLVLGRFILSNKVARIVTFCYAVCLHLLVFLVISRILYADSCENATFMQCAQLFSEHMQLYHPDNAKEVMDSLGHVPLHAKLPPVGHG